MRSKPVVSKVTTASSQRKGTSMGGLMKLTTQAGRKGTSMGGFPKAKPLGGRTGTTMGSFMKKTSSLSGTLSLSMLGEMSDDPVAIKTLID